MYILNISIYNFQCFYKDVEFDFNKGLNFVLGANGHGKSKLFNAFYWIITDRLLNEEGKDYKPNKFDDNLINRKALHYAEVNDYIKVSSTLIVEHYDNFFKIKREYGAKKVELSNKKVFQFDEDSKLLIYIYNNSLGKYSLVNDNPEDLIKEIFPENNRDYLWFQGEQGLDKILNFENSKALDKAINVLSDIGEIKKLVDITESLDQIVKKEFDDYQSTNSKKNLSIKEYQEKRDRLENEQMHIEDKIEEINNRIKDLETEKKQIDDFFSQYDYISRINNEFHSKKASLKEIASQLYKKKLKFSDLLFSRHWLLKGLKNDFNNFRSLYGSYTNIIIRKKNTNQNEQNYLPDGVPDLGSLKKMLDEEICGLCFRDAYKNSEAYKNIEKIYNKQKELDSATNLQFSFEKELKDYDDEAFYYGKKIGEIDKDYLNYLNDIAELEEKQKDLEAELNDIEVKLTNEINAHNITGDEADNMISQRNRKEQEIQEWREEVGKLENKKNTTEEELTKTKKYLSTHQIQNIPEHLHVKRKLSDSLNEIIKNTKRREYKKLIGDIENKSNEYYEIINKGSGAFHGRIKLEESNRGYRPLIVDENDNDIRKSVSTSIRQSLKLSIIMAISSLKRNLQDRYPMISDAATSNFDDEKMKNYYREVAQSFNQAIIITKDFIKQSSNNQRWEFDEENFEDIKKEIQNSLGNIFIISIPENIPMEQMNEIQVNVERKF